MSRLPLSGTPGEAGGNADALAPQRIIRVGGQDAAADRVNLGRLPRCRNRQSTPHFLAKVRQSASVVTGIGKTYVVPNGGEVCKRFNRGYLAGNSNLTYVRMHSVRLRASR